MTGEAYFFFVRFFYSHQVFFFIYIYYSISRDMYIPELFVYINAYAYAYDIV